MIGSLKNNRQKLIICLGFFMTVSICPAQQDPQFSQNMYNIMMFNPGYAGSKDAICATALNRQQWAGFDNAPVTSAFAINSPFRLFGAEHGAGLHILNDQAGFQNNLGISLTYAYRTDAGPGKIGVGASFGLINNSLDAEWEVPQSDHHTHPSSDPSIPAGNESILIPDFSFGIYYNTDHLYFGLSATHITEPVMEYSGSATSFLSRHYYMTAGYSFALGNPDLELTPSVMVLSDGSISQVSAGGQIIYDDKLWGGLYYRSGSAVVGMAGLEIFNGIQLGYSYDFATSSLNRHSKGSHEFVLRYCFSLSIDRTTSSHKSIRIL